MNHVVIVGGGASGLVAAIAASRAGAKVTILEKKDRIGKKILATGNGRCNLGNEDLSIAHFVSQDINLVAQVIKTFGKDSGNGFFQALGLEIVCEEGRLYPRSKQAAGVLDVLRHELDRLGVKVETDAPVLNISYRKGNFVVTYGTDKVLSTNKLVLATGGKAGPQLGCTGDGYTLAAGLGHTVLTLSPALVGLRLQSPHLKGMSGLRVEAEVSIPELNVREEGEIIFTDYGISGIPVFDLTRLIGGKKGLTLVVRLAVDSESLGALSKKLAERLRQLSHKGMSDALIGYLPKQLVSPILKECGIGLDTLAGKLTKRHVEELAKLLWQWEFPIIGLNTWEQAQTTSGGVPLHEVDIPSFQSRKQPGLYLTGELLDVHGRCGGYNLHWAWASGFLAGQHAGKDNKQP